MTSTVARSVLVTLAVLAVLSSAMVGGATLLFREGSRTQGTAAAPADLMKLQPDLAPDPQKAALADGVVTWEEYVAAVRANTECIRGKGVPVTDAVIADGRVQKGIVGPMATDAEMERANKVVLECNATYLNAVGLQWYRQTMPSPGTFAAAREELAACLRGAGVALPEKDGRPDFAAVAQSDPARFSPCSAQVGEKFGIPGFAG